MIVLALAVILSGALPAQAEPVGNPANWLLSSDVPVSEWSRARVTSYDLTLDSAGEPVNCIITNPSGSDIIDGIVCSSIMRRARYKPAKDEAGNAIPSVVRDHVQWRPNASGSNQYHRDTPDVIVSNSSASSKKRFDLVKVVVVIGASGAIERCSIFKSSKIEKLDEEACATVSRPEISMPVLDSSKMPIRGVRAFGVGFIAGAGNQIIIR